MLTYIFIGCKPLPPPFRENNSNVIIEEFGVLSLGNSNYRVSQNK